jgi:hypothetical protein
MPCPSWTNDAVKRMENGTRPWAYIITNTKKVITNACLITGKSSIMRFIPFQGKSPVAGKVTGQTGSDILSFYSAQLYAVIYICGRYV